MEHNYNFVKNEEDMDKLKEFAAESLDKAWVAQIIKSIADIVE